MRKQGSILIIVLFILFLSSLGAILVTKYVNNILDYSSEFFKYYKSYYYSYAGIELGLTKANYHGFGFEDTIGLASQTNSKNFLDCSGLKCGFDLKLSSRSNIVSSRIDSNDISNCQQDDSITLSQGQGVIVPLFNDLNNGEGSLANISYENLSSNDFNDLGIHIYGGNLQNFTIGVSDESNSSNKLYKGIGVGSDYVLNLNMPQFNGFYNSSNKSFLIIANVQNYSSKIGVCLFSNVNKVPYGYERIESTGKYIDRYVTLEAVKRNNLPEYLIYNIIK